MHCHNANLQRLPISRSTPNLLDFVSVLRSVRHVQYHCWLPPMFVQAGEDGHVYAAVQYPSLRELWPDVYFTEAVKTVQARRTMA